VDRRVEGFLVDAEPVAGLFELVDVYRYGSLGYTGGGYFDDAGLGGDEDA
jgi:hypothetical protein